MMFFAEWNVILFLCSPIMNDIPSLQFAGLYINDLAMHDFSRDLLLTGKKYFMTDIWVWLRFYIIYIVMNYIWWMYQIPFHWKQTGSQKANELKDALEAENEKSKQMQEAMKKVDIEMKRSDELLAQMIPKAVADKVKKGLNPVDTCEVFIIFVHKILQKETLFKRIKF